MKGDGPDVRIVREDRRRTVSLMDIAVHDRNLNQEDNTKHAKIDDE